MFISDPYRRHTMPAHFGPLDRKEQEAPFSAWYNDTTMIAVNYVTDAEKLAGYLPKGFEPAEEAVITVYFCCNKDVDWLAGHGYNMIGVNAAVIFKGQEEALEGTYSLAVWENLADPIIRGRELQGIPKIFADIPDHTERDGKFSTSASHFGHKIIDISIENLFPLNEELIAQFAESQVGKDHPMTCRYIEAMGDPSTGLNQIITFPSESIHREFLVGEGSVEWQQLTWEQNPTQFHIVNALAGLPILSYLPSLVTKGSMNVEPEGRPMRVLT